MLKSSALALCVAIVLMQPVRAEISGTDRQRLAAHLEMTRSWFLDEVSYLTRTQLQFRPAPAAWSIMEVIDHLVVVGEIY